MYLNNCHKANQTKRQEVKPGHEMYLNKISPITSIIENNVKPGHEMYLNLIKAFKLPLSYISLNQDMRCI